MSQAKADKMVAASGGGGPSTLLDNPKHIKSDARILRRLIRSPIYVPNDYFRSAAKKLWDIATGAEEDRIRVAAIKTINDICKVNLLVRERQSDKPNINLHLHKHEHTTNVEGLSEAELLQLKALMEKAGLT